MPSNRLLAVALAAMVLLSGCSMLPGGGDAAPDAPDHHGLSFTSHTGGEAFNATVTVEQDGSVLFEDELSSDGDGTFANLTTLTEPGPYTVTVNTTVSGASGNRSDRTQVTAPLGNETVVEVTDLGIYFETLELPRRAMDEPLRFQKNIPMPIESTVVVSYQGEELVSRSVAPNSTEPVELADLPETGVYWVAVSGPDGETWTNETVVIDDPGARLFAKLDADTPKVVLNPESVPQ
jgi:hypothetical protein